MLSKIINNETKQVELGYKEYENFYLENRFIEQDVEQASDGSWYLKGFAPINPPLTDAEIKELRAQEYITIIDPITAEISRLRDEEATDINQAEIKGLIQLRQTKVEEIKNKHPYNT